MCRTCFLSLLVGLDSHCVGPVFFSLLVGLDSQCVGPVFCLYWLG